MAESVGEIYYSVEARTDALIVGERQANQSLDRLQTGFNKTDRAAEKLGGGMSTLAAAIKGVIAATVLRDIANMVQGYQEMEDRIKLATRSTEEYRQVQDRLLNTANATYRSLTEAQELYVLTADSLRGMGYSLEQALDVQDSLSFAFVKNATSVERAKNAIQAFTGSMNKGKVEADNWASVVAAIPTVVNDIATASGKSAAEIRALGAAGKLTAAQLSEGLRKSLEGNTTAAAAMTNNLRDAGVRVRTAFTQLFVTMENQTGALQSLTDGIIEAADALLKFGQNGDDVANVMTLAGQAAMVLASVYAGRLLTSIGSYTIAQGQSLLATIAQNKADTEAAAATVRRVAVERDAAVAAVAVAKAEFEAARGTNAHGLAATQLTAARDRATTAVAAYTAAQTRANAIATVGTVAMTGLRTAMGFLGGPAGLILLAASALYSFSTTANEAKPPVDLLTESVNSLGDAAIRLNRIKINEKLEELKGAGGAAMASGASVEWLKKQLSEFPSSAKADEWRQRLVEQEAAAEKAGDEVKTYTDRLAALDKEMERRAKGGARGDGTTPNLTAPKIDDGKAEKAAEKAAKALQTKIEDLQLEADMLGMTATEQELYRLQLDGASDAQIRSAATSLALVEAYKAQTKAAEDAAAAEEKKRQKFGDDATEAKDYIRGDVDPLSGGGFDDQYARYEAEAKAEEERYAAQLERLKVAQEMRIEVVGGYQALEQQMAQEHADRIKQIDDAKNSMMLSSGASFFDSMASMAKNFAGESSGAYKAMFAVAKAFALADAGLRLSSAIAQAMADPTALTPAQKFANMAAVAAAGASVVSQISSAAFTGRQYGGPVQAGSMYRVNEGGDPEVFNAANGQQFMLPNSRGEVVSNKNASGGGTGITNVISITVDSSGAATTNVGSSSSDANMLAQGIRVVVVDELERQSRPNGLLWKMGNQNG